MHRLLGVCVNILSSERASSRYIQTTSFLTCAESVYLGKRGAEFDLNGPFVTCSDKRNVIEIEYSFCDCTRLTVMSYSEFHSDTCWDCCEEHITFYSKQVSVAQRRCGKICMPTIPKWSACASACRSTRLVYQVQEAYEASHGIVRLPRPSSR